MPRKPKPTSTSLLPAETLLAFGFGVVFCGVLAYAGLRSEPITDPGQFFFLRVLAAISAAGVAAVIPGLLNIQIGQGKLFAIRGAGALGIFVLIYSVNPPELIHRASDTRRAAMSGNYAQGLYEDANRIADEILRDQPTDAQALNIKGGIAFYRRDFASAVEFFRQAHMKSPKNPAYASNYANALIETQAYTAALEIFKSINDGKRDRSYGLGRAYFYAGNYPEARKLLEGVPSEYWHGAARILEAASIVAMANQQQDPAIRTSLLSQGQSKFRIGYLIDRRYWDDILSGANKDKHQDYHVVIDLLAPLRQNLASSVD